MKISLKLLQIAPRIVAQGTVALIMTPILMPATAFSTEEMAADPIIQPAPLVSIASHDSFFESIRALCGKAFAGKITVDNQPTSSMADKPLVMHVRRCKDDVLHIPFHVGEDASRTWIITKTGSGLSLKHDHRHEDGSYSESTMYGGHTLDAGWPQVQSFPADAYSKALFAKSGIPQSSSNIWQMFIYPETFTYRLIREGREFRVDFDLTQPIPVPAAPWGYAK